MSAGTDVEGAADVAVVFVALPVTPASSRFNWLHPSTAVIKIATLTIVVACFIRSVSFSSFVRVFRVFRGLVLDCQNYESAN
jgi:hypothetical protein